MKKVTKKVTKKDKKALKFEAKELYLTRDEFDNSKHKYSYEEIAKKLQLTRMSICRWVNVKDTDTGLSWNDLWVSGHSVPMSQKELVKYEKDTQKKFTESEKIVEIINTVIINSRQKAISISEKLLDTFEKEFDNYAPVIQIKLYEILSKQTQIIENNTSEKDQPIIINFTEAKKECLHP
jgi:hypothetical protein